MDIVEVLNRELSGQDFSTEQPCSGLLARYKEVALNYALMENAVAVLSDLQVNVSHIYYGGFARTLGIGRDRRDECVTSIWEEEIFSHIHPDDLARKHLQELCFFHFVKRQPRKRRADYYLMSRLHMRTRTNVYLPVLHRMFYVSVSPQETLRLALCLYSPLSVEIPGGSLIVNSLNGHTAELETRNQTRILSSREKEILKLIDRGFISKEIAEMLCISVNTVSRHRQEILNRLQVKNSIEACRIAKDLNLI